MNFNMLRELSDDELTAVVGGFARDEFPITVATTQSNRAFIDDEERRRRRERGENEISQENENSTRISQTIGFFGS